MQNPLKNLHDLSDFPVDVRREMYALANGDPAMFTRLYRMVRETHDRAWSKGHDEGGYDEREAQSYLDSVGG